MIHEHGVPANESAGGRGRPTGMQNLLRLLAMMSPSPWPVLSVYVNTRGPGGAVTPYRPFLKKALGEALARLAPRSPEHESLGVDIGRVQNYLDSQLREATSGVAMFACFGDGDMFESVQIPQPFPEPIARVGPLPWLFPLIAVADRSQRAAVLLSDSHAARLFVVSLGQVEVRREVRSPLTQRVRGAGEADALHAQRHVEEARKKHTRLAVATLEELARESAAKWLVVGGEAGTLPELEAALSRDACEKLLVPPSTWDVRIAEPALVERVQSAMDARESEARLALAARIADPAQAGRTACGPAETISALRDARVQELVLSSAFPADRPGWACLACRGFGEGEAAGACPACGRPDTQAVLLREEIAHQALAQGARVHVVQAGRAPAFDARGGVGVLLRYA